MHPAQSPRLLVTGASGHLGRQVAEMLIGMGASVILTSRDPHRSGFTPGASVDVRAADFDEPTSLKRAFSGADRLLLISVTTGSGAHGGEQNLRLKRHEAALDAAAAAGVSHVVYTSLIAPRPNGDAPSVHSDHYWTEHSIAARFASWTILRFNHYAEMMLQTLVHAAATGSWLSAAGPNGRTSFLTRQDCARACAHALMSEYSGRRILEVTGPQAYGRMELATWAADIANRPIAPEFVTPERLRAHLRSLGLSAQIAESFVQFDVATALGYDALVTPAMRELCGTDAVPFDAFLRAHAAELIRAAESRARTGVGH